MKRKASKVGKLRLSPNEETMLLKEEYDRRRKLRLQQVCFHFCKLSVSEWKIRFISYKLASSL